MEGLAGGLGVAVEWQAAPNAPPPDNKPPPNLHDEEGGGGGGGYTKMIFIYPSQTYPRSDKLRDVVAIAA